MMSKKQTRRSVSISGELYDALKAYADGCKSTQSGIVESVMRKLVGLPQRNGTGKVIAPVDNDTGDPDDICVCDHLRADHNPECKHIDGDARCGCRKFDGGSLFYPDGRAKGSLRLLTPRKASNVKDF